MRLIQTRALLTSLSLSGAIETGYLSYSKFASLPISETFCGSSSLGSTCNDVLNSPYAIIPAANIPLVSIGFLGYLCVAALVNKYDYSDDRKENGTIGSMILSLTTAMGCFSCYLMTLLVFSINTSCTYCIFSAFLSISMALVAWQSKIVSNKTTAAVVTSSSVAITSIASAFLFYVTSNIASPQVAQASTAPAAQVIAKIDESAKKRAPLITKHSSPQALSLGEKLVSLDAKMYGAYWCSHCFNQKQELGMEAFEKIPYFECDKEGHDTQFRLCREKKIPGFPTWEIKGKLYPGEKTIEELEALITNL